MDITSISTLIGSLKTATEIAKFIKETGLSLEQAETKLKLADLISTLADARVEVAGIQQELLEREEQIRELRKQLELKDALVYEAPSYWLHDESTKDGPFCQTCYDSGAKLIRLQGPGNGYWECKSCKSSFMEARYHAELRSHNNSSLDYDPLNR